MTTTFGQSLIRRDLTTARTAFVAAVRGSVARGTADQRFDSSSCRAIGATFSASASFLVATSVAKSMGKRDLHIAWAAGVVRAASAPSQALLRKQDNLGQSPLEGQGLRHRLLGISICGG